MSYKIYITAAAQRDMANASDHIDFVLKNPKAAENLLDEAEMKISELALFPEKFALVEDSLLASWGIRCIQVKNYLAFYIISEADTRIIVLRFLYGKSNWASILKQGFSLR